MQELNKTAIGIRIKKRREEMRMSREKLAELLDVTPKFCYDIESGHRGFSLETLCRIAECLNLTTEYILYGDEPLTNDRVFLQTIEKCPPSKRDYLFSVMEIIIESYNTDEREL